MSLRARDVDPAAPHGVEIERVRTFARVLDRYGVDAVLGFFVPGLGDVLGSLLGLYIVSIAMRRGVAGVVIARMLLNLGLDMVLGVVPVVGDLADVAFQANVKNLALLESRAATRQARASDWLMVGGVAIGFVAVTALLVYAMIALFGALGRALG